jgi:UDP-N-acetyl-D-galactosamine dehydrogenase
VKHEYNLITSTQLPEETFDAIVLGVAHKEFLNFDFQNLKRTNAIVI